MKNLFFVLLFLCSYFSSYGQIVINEIDADTPSSDILEFVELKSTEPTFSLDGYVLVFFNGTTSGTGTLSYYSLDLDGLKTDVNGIITIGNPTVSPTPALTFPVAKLENGPDAVALYIGNATDFPLGTNAKSSGLINALTYSDKVALKPTALMNVL